MFDHILAAVRNPAGIIEELRQVSEGLRQVSVDSRANLDQRISSLKGQFEKRRDELATLTMQRTKENIAQKMYESLPAPVNNLLTQLAENIAGLEEQKKLAEGWDCSKSASTPTLRSTPRRWKLWTVRVCSGSCICWVYAWSLGLDGCL